jgi:prepilin-type N-terminal cleavage/methylation domain-containing protein
MNSSYKSKNNKKAFTLIELLIVIAIIGILFIVLVSKVDFATDKAKATGVQTDFRSFQVAFEQVSKENAGFATFGWDTGDKSKDSLWNSKTTPDGQSYSYENKDKDAGDRIKNSYDQGDANLNGIQESTETWVGRKIYTEEWTNIWTLTNPNGNIDYSAIAALEAAINANLDPKLHITINNDYTITMANQARDPWGNEYHGVYISNARNDNMDRGAIIIYSDGANGKWGSAHGISGGIVSITIPGNNVYGQDDYSIVSCYTYANGYGESVTMTEGFNNNQKFLAGGNKNTVDASQIKTLAGTTWKLHSNITYDSQAFGGYEEWARWTNFPEGVTITNGAYTHKLHGLSTNTSFGVQFFNTYYPTSEPWSFVYLPENPFGVPVGWTLLNTEFCVRWLNNQVTDPTEVIDNMRHTGNPTIMFPQQSNADLEDPHLIQWFYNNAELQ